MWCRLLLIITDYYYYYYYYYYQYYYYYYYYYYCYYFYIWVKYIHIIYRTFISPQFSLLRVSLLIPNAMALIKPAKDMLMTFRENRSVPG